jgi:hypothetical protein
VEKALEELGVEKALEELGLGVEKALEELGLGVEKALEELGLGKPPTGLGLVILPTGLGVGKLLGLSRLLGELGLKPEKFDRFDEFILLCRIRSS